MSAVGSAPRCAAHPTRLAAEKCPVCGRDRCAPDVAALGARGCSVCTPVLTAQGPAPSRAEVAVRAGLAAYAVALPGGWIANQYVNVHLMSLGWPAVLGVGASWAAAAAATRRAREQWLVLGLAVVGALLGTALGFRLFDTPVTPVHPLRQVWLPYVAAVFGVVAWPLLFATPRRAKAGEGQPAGTGTRLNR